MEEHILSAIDDLVEIVLSSCSNELGIIKELWSFGISCRSYEWEHNVSYGGKEVYRHYSAKQWNIETIYEPGEWKNILEDAAKKVINHQNIVEQTQNIRSDIYHFLSDRNTISYLKGEDYSCRPGYKYSDEKVSFSYGDYSEYGRSIDYELNVLGNCVYKYILRSSNADLLEKNRFEETVLIYRPGKWEEYLHSISSEKHHERVSLEEKIKTQKTDPYSPINDSAIF